MHTYETRENLNFCLGLQLFFRLFSLVDSLFCQGTKINSLQTSLYAMDQTDKTKIQCGKWRLHLFYLFFMLQKYSLKKLVQNNSY